MITTISYIPKLLRALSLRETDPMSALSPLRDGTTTPRTGPHRYKWVNAWKITRRLPVLNHIRRWLYTEGLGLLDYVERRSAQGILPVVSRSTKPIRAQSEDTPVRQRRWIHLLRLQIVHVRERDPTLKDRSLYPHTEWRGGTDQSNDPGESDDYVRCKGPSQIR